MTEEPLAWKKGGWDNPYGDGLAGIRIATLIFEKRLEPEDTFEGSDSIS